MSRIASASVAECAIPLPQPIRLGKSEIRSRDFVALRVTTDEGFVGEAIGYVRGTPLFETMEKVVRCLPGADALMRREIITVLEQSNIPGRAAFTRALSLIDIALWDITAKVAGMPLFQLLGGASRETRASAVAGYRLDVRTVDDVKTEVARRFDEGYARVKVMLHGADLKRDQRIIEAVSSLGGRIAADAHWSWASMTDAYRYCRGLDSLGLDFLEDPFAPSDWRLSHELQRTVRTAIAAGEDLVGAAQVDQLVRGIALLRVDATTCGGITGAIEAINIAAAAGRNVLPHVFAPIHAHLACAFPNVEGVEVVPADAAADPLEILLRSRADVIDGAIRPSAQPGIGLELDWESIRRFTIHGRTTISGS